MDQADSGSAPGGRADGQTDAELESVTLRKVAWRLIPFMFLVYVVNILDRTNLNAASVALKPALRLSDADYGFASGILFLGYLLLQIPSNLMLDRLGARRWIGWIVIAWGVVSACMMFSRDLPSLSFFRFMLGVAQAGFFPGMVLYLTYWFPNSIRGRAASRFILAGQVAAVINNPLGAALLRLDGVAGLAGWQWLFLLEGIPACLLGVAVFFLMTSRPEQAYWLKPAEMDWLIRTLAWERSHREKHHAMKLSQVFRYPRVLHLTLIFFLNLVAGAGVSSFLNLILKARFGGSNQDALIIGTLPAICGALSLLYFSALSDRTGERRLFVVVGLAISAVAISVAAWTRNPWLTVGAICIQAIGTQMANGPFWALTTGFLTGTAAAGGIAFINSLGNSGQFFGPMVMGQVPNAETGLFILGGVWVLASLAAYFLPEDPATRTAATAA